jgi:hypothetical protein
MKVEFRSWITGVPRQSGPRTGPGGSASSPADRQRRRHVAENALRPFAINRWLRSVHRDLEAVHAVSMSLLFDRLVHDQVALKEVSVVAADPLAVVVDLSFTNGVAVRLTRCHLGAAVNLSELVGTRMVLEQARHHGVFWALYFRGNEGRKPILSRDALAGSSPSTTPREDRAQG